MAETARHLQSRLTRIPEAISLGYSSSTGALFGAIYNVASGVGRIGFGVFADMLVGVSNQGETRIAKTDSVTSSL
jgi:hypothetical protein